ncbi:hypothetical protein Nmel_006520, partial [Mimus melanotis]
PLIKCFCFVLFVCLFVGFFCLFLLGLKVIPSQGSSSTLWVSWHSSSNQ